MRSASPRGRPGSPPARRSRMRKPGQATMKRPSGDVLRAQARVHEVLDQREGRAPQRHRGERRRLPGAATGTRGTRAGLAAEPSRLDVLAPQRAGPELRIAEAVVQHLEDRKARVEADQIGQRERAERVAHAEPHDRVDRLGIADALVQAEGRLVEHRQQHPVGQEAGHVARLGHGLAHRLGRGAHAPPSRRSSRGRGSARPAASAAGGFMKCIPQTWAGRCVAAAGAPIGIEDVLDARTRAASRAASSRRKSASLSSTSSLAASIASSASPQPSGRSRSRCAPALGRVVALALGGELGERGLDAGETARECSSPTSTSVTRMPALAAT